MDYFYVNRGNRYNDELKKIDERILKLIKERRKKTEGKRMLPPKEVVETWADQLELDHTEISQLIHFFNRNAALEVPNEKGNLTGILPIMKRTEKNDVEYVITHALQYENVSELFLDIINKKDEFVSLRPQLLLNIQGDQEYRVRRNGMSGGNTGLSLRFLVSPRLTDELEGIRFSLIPFAEEMHPKIVEKILDEHVDLD